MKESTPPPSTKAPIYLRFRNWNTPMKEGTPPPLPKPPFFYVFETGTQPDERRHPSPLYRSPCFFTSSKLKNTNFLGKYHFQKKRFKTKNVYLDEVYNFFKKYFAKFCELAEINAKKHDFDSFFCGFSMKIDQSPIFTIIFVISASKYINIVSFKLIGGTTFSELYPFC